MIPFIFEDGVKAEPGERIVALPGELKDKTALFDFLRCAIPLPHYFGENWDALEECLGDLAWLKDEKLVLMHEEVPLQETPSAQQVYLQILAKAAQEEKRLKVSFPKKGRALVEQILAA